LWNFGGTHEIHKRILTQSSRIAWVASGKEERDKREAGMPRSTYSCSDEHELFGSKKSIHKIKFGNHIGGLEKQSKTQAVFLQVHFAVLLLTQAVLILEATMSKQKIFL